MSSPWYQFAEKIDWVLLREQKCELLMRCDRETHGNDYIVGIVHLLDHLQDAAVAEGFATSDEVFGPGFGPIGEPK